MSTTTPHLLRAPLAAEAGTHLHTFTQPGHGPTVRIAHLGALHGYLIAAGAMPQRGCSHYGNAFDLLEDARAVEHPAQLPDTLHPDDIGARFTLQHVTFPDNDGLYWPNLRLERPYLAGLLYGYRQGVSERAEPRECPCCGRVVIAGDTDDTAECPYRPGAAFCDSTHHAAECGNPADCFGK